MMKILCCLLLIVFCQGILSHRHGSYKGKILKESGAVLRIDVKKGSIGHDANGNVEEKFMKIDLLVVYKDGQVYVNGIPAKQSYVTLFNTTARVVDISSNTEINVRRVPVVIRVLVKDHSYRKYYKKVTRLSIEEQIIEVEGKKVFQMDIKEMVVQVGCRGNKHVYYKLNLIKLEESEIHHRDPKHDHHHRHHHHHHRPAPGAPDREPDRESDIPDRIYHGFESLPLPARIAIYVGGGVLGLLVLIGLYKLCCASSNRRSTEQTYVDNVKLAYNPNTEVSEIEEKKPEKKPEEVKKAFEEVIVA